MMTLVDSMRRLNGYRFPRLGGLAFRTAFKLLPEQANVELMPGIRADLDFRDATMRSTYWQGERYERPTARVLSDWAREGATRFFDIGSNYGFFCYWLLSQSPKIEVHAFEPNPKTFAAIESIRAANSLARMHTANIGLGDIPARLRLHPGLTDSGHCTFGDNPQLDGSLLEEIDVLPFDTWRRAAGLELPRRPEWIAKIDVEGFEARVLRGMAGAMAAGAFAGLVVEMNEFTLNFCGSSTAELSALMAGHGYTALHFGEDCGNAFFVPAAKLNGA